MKIGIFGSESFVGFEDTLKNKFSLYESVDTCSLYIPKLDSVKSRASPL